MKYKILLSVLYFFFFTQLTGTAQIISTIAGIPGSPGYSGDGGPAAKAQLYHPFSVATDNKGNVYIGDGVNGVIRKVDVNGVISTIAGNGIRGYSGDGGPATAAQINVAYFTIDNAGNIYITGEHEVRKINTAGIISTIAGNGTFGYSGDGGPATSAQLVPGDIAVDNSSGIIYVADYHNGRIRKIDASGIITTFAGNGIHESFNETGTATSVPIIPSGLAVDKSGNLYVADNNFMVRKITPAGIISTIAGDIIHGYRGDGGPAINALLNSPYNIDVDIAGNIYIADYDNHRIRKINTAGIITTIGGTGVQGYAGDGGLATRAQLTFPTSVAVDVTGNVYFADPTTETVRKITGCLAVADPSVSITASVAEVCPGKPMMFTATPVNGGTAPAYEWKVNGTAVAGNTEVITLSSLAEGDIVSCVLTSSLRCTAPVISNTIAIHHKPAPVVTFAGEITILPGGSAPLNPSITGTITTYQWTPADGLSNTTIVNPVATPAKTTTYQLKVISADGCEGTGKVTVSIYKKLVMPNAFTPNLDGKNELFRIPAGTTFTLKDFSIYHRWGGIIFRTSDMAKGWDGNHKGNPAAAGLYVYSITGLDRGQPVVFKGVVLLIR